VQFREIGGVMTQIWQGGGPDLLPGGYAQEVQALLGCMQGKGLVGGILVVESSTKTPIPDMAFQVTITCLDKGLVMIASVGADGQCVKIAPPLTIPYDELRESIQVLEDTVDWVLGGKRRSERPPLRHGFS